MFLFPGIKNNSHKQIYKLTIEQKRANKNKQTNKQLTKQTNIRTILKTNNQ